MYGTIAHIIRSTKLIKRVSGMVFNCFVKELNNLQQLYKCTNNALAFVVVVGTVDEFVGICFDICKCTFSFGVI